MSKLLVVIFSILGSSFISLGLAVGLAIFLMMTTKTVHPPAGANPIIAILGAKDIGFIIMPVAIGASFIILFAIIYNKILNRSYFNFKDLFKNYVLKIKNNMFNLFFLFWFSSVVTP